MDQDPMQGGTEADGSRSKKYCSLCYDKGAFKDNFTTSAEMVKFVKGKLKEAGYGWLKRWFYTSHIPKLERWKR
jgi:hypothetical protein